MRAACLALCLLGGSTVSAQEAAEPSDAVAAREAFEAGLAAARAGDWSTARARFERSHALSPRASALFNLAGAEVQTGALLRAAEHYREYLGRGDDTSVERAAEARAALDRLEARIPTVRLLVTGLVGGDEVRLDDVVIASFDAPIPLDPGPHRVSVVRGGVVIASSDHRATEGAHAELALAAPDPRPDLTVAEPPPELDPPIEPALTPTPRATEGDDADVLEAWWLWTIVGAVVVGGLVAGLVIAFTTPGSPPDSHGFLSPQPVRVP